MHSKIIEISTKPFECEENYMNEGSFSYELFSDFADYVQDINRDRDETIMRWLDNHGIFERNGRELTLLDLTDFMEDWRKEIIKKANNIDFTDGLALAKLRNVIKETHRETELMFYFEEEFMNLGQLAHYLYNYHRPGDKFYVGGILDYHY